MLAPGGRVIIFDPAIGLTGRFVYGLFHHEPLGMRLPLTWEAPAGFDPADADYFAAQGSATRIFWRREDPGRLAGWDHPRGAAPPLLRIPRDRGVLRPPARGPFAFRLWRELDDGCFPCRISLQPASRGAQEDVVIMVLVTGSAGFIGFHVSLRLLREGHAVHGVDNMNDYYDVGLKEARTRILKAQKGFTFHTDDLADAAATARVFDQARPGLVLHFAAQAGVRHSLSNPRAYADSNLIGFLNVLEGCRAHRPEHLLYASSSSVYGLNTALPFSVHQPTDHPVSFYAATKKANELMAHSYSHLFGIPTTGVRLFTVYGPWGRPDMALFAFTRAILAGKPIEIFGDGLDAPGLHLRGRRGRGRPAALAEARRARAGVERRRAPDPASSSAPYRLYNIGNHSTTEVLRLIEVLEECLGGRRRSGSSRRRPARSRRRSPTPRTWSGTRDTRRRPRLRRRRPVCRVVPGSTTARRERPMPRAVSTINAAHLERIRAWYDEQPDAAQLGLRSATAQSWPTTTAS